MDLAAAIRRFPARARALEELAARDEAFCSLCFDFRDAETALHQWANSDSPKQDQRCAEYSELIDYLASEVESALDEAAIIPIGRSRPKPR